MAIYVYDPDNVRPKRILEGAGISLVETNNTVTFASTGSIGSLFGTGSTNALALWNGSNTLYFHTGTAYEPSANRLKHNGPLSIDGTLSLNGTFGQIIHSGTGNLEFLNPDGAPVRWAILSGVTKLYLGGGSEGGLKIHNGSTGTGVGILDVVSIGTNPIANFYQQTDSVLGVTIGRRVSTDNGIGVQIGAHTGSGYGYIQSFNFGSNAETELRIQPSAGPTKIFGTLTLASSLTISGTTISNFLQYNRELVTTKNSVIMTGSIYVPLPIPLDSTSYDGNDTVTTGTLTIDTSAVFGAPAGIKACQIFVQRVNTNSIMTFRTTASSSIVMVIGGVGASFNLEYANFTIPCDANGDFYIATTGQVADFVVIRIIGYYI